MVPSQHPWGIVQARGPRWWTRLYYNLSELSHILEMKPNPHAGTEKLFTGMACLYECSRCGKDLPAWDSPMPLWLGREVVLRCWGSCGSSEHDHKLFLILPWQILIFNIFVLEKLCSLHKSWLTPHLTCSDSLSCYRMQEGFSRVGLLHAWLYRIFFNPPKIEHHVRLFKIS